MQEKKQTGPWHQDNLEPRIVLDPDGEFFAIGVSSHAAARIAASLNRTEVAGIALESEARPRSRDSSH